MMNEKKKAIAFTAFMIFISLLTVISLFFLISAAVSPPGKYIKVGVFCDETGEPVPPGLAITVKGDGFGPTTQLTRADGYTDCFGSGLPDGTYNIWFCWNGLYNYTVEVHCTQITWVFDYYVPNPVIAKHFEYEAGSCEGDPIPGLNVRLVEGGVVIATEVTDEDGNVIFGGDVVEVCKEYYLNYTWGGVEYSEGPIHFEYVDGKLEDCLAELTNYLEPKGGGDK